MVIRCLLLFGLLIIFEFVLKLIIIIIIIIKVKLFEVIIVLRGQLKVIYILFITSIGLCIFIAVETNG